MTIGTSFQLKPYLQVIPYRVLFVEDLLFSTLEEVPSKFKSRHYANKIPIIIWSFFSSWVRAWEVQGIYCSIPSRGRFTYSYGIRLGLVIIFLVSWAFLWFEFHVMVHIIVLIIIVAFFTLFMLMLMEVIAINLIVGYLMVVVN